MCMRGKSRRGVYFYLVRPGFRFCFVFASHLPCSYLVPGQIYQLEVDLNVTSNLFKKGHQIRIDISSSCFPR